MKNSCRGALLVGLLLLGLASARAGEGANWLTDFPKAQAEARAQGKLLLIDFTGSDWCGWCKRLQAEVFSKPEFADFATKNLILMKADFPRAKPISDEVRKQNHALAERFEVAAFPTIVILNPEGKQVGLLGYQRGGPAPFIEEIRKLPKG